jgi:hypothetical protein
MLTGKIRRRPGPTFSPPTWAKTSPNTCEPFIWDQRWRASLTGIKPRRNRSPETLATSFTPRLFLYTSRENVRARRLAAGGAVPPASPLTGMRCSPEGEHSTVEPARSSALRWRPEPTRRWPDKRRRTHGGPGPFPERIVFDDGRSSHGGAAATPRCDCRRVLRRVQVATVPTSGGGRRAPSWRMKRQIRCGGEVSPATLSLGLGLGYSIRVPSF